MFIMCAFSVCGIFLTGRRADIPPPWFEEKKCHWHAEEFGMIEPSGIMPA